MFLDYFALGMLIFVALVLFYGVIAIHDIPYEIAKERDHPHQDAIHYAGWVSLFTLHALWPFLWIWASLWRKERGWGFEELTKENRSINEQVELLRQEVTTLKAEMAAFKTANGSQDNRSEESK